ncbi:Hypothetical predicted protein [Mytilus galloprovincialis]|uniref:Ig-like domain-containing protein n=1 Tax=Mytilus galloprovincialis TaxID=29158 RepID=A0A8B6FGE5_MYTGA|nr:Hypothetical predicted protein [Mytilus galloprovincialis]
MVYTIDTQEGDISWTLLTKPVIFGKDASLKCHLTSESKCCDSFARKWSAGKTFDLIMMNGVSSNATKYTETVDNRFNTSSLTIKNFSKNDVNIPYECTYGFDTFSKTLELTKANFEFYPDEQIPVDLAIDENRIAALNVTFKTIFPAPVCSASDDVQNISSKLLVKTDKNGTFFTSNIQLLYDVGNSCNRIVVVQCTIGRTHLTIVNTTISCQQASVTVQIVKPLLLSSGALLLVVAIVLCIVYLVRRKCTCLKARDHIEEQRDSNQRMVTPDDGNEMDILSQDSDVLEDTTDTPQELYT